MKDVKQKLSNLNKFVLVAVSTGLVTTGAHAEGTGIDVTSIVSTFKTDITTAVSAVGMALLAVAGVAIVFKWVKASFFS
jgi:3-deoxy-D-arabino-heptulosonate 7-phosphate (DAHP) synthase class II